MVSKAIRVNVRAKPYSNREEVEKIDDSNFVVYTKSALEKGKANLSIKKSLASYFDVALCNISLIRGNTSRDKVFEILI